MTDMGDIAYLSSLFWLRRSAFDPDHLLNRYRRHRHRRSTHMPLPHGVCAKSPIRMWKPARRLESLSRHRRSRIPCISVGDCYVGDVNRETRFDLVLRHLMSGNAPRPAIPASDDVFDRALESLMHFWDGDYESAASLAAVALRDASDPDARALACAAAALAVAGWFPAAHDPALVVDPRTGQDPLRAALSDIEHLTPAFVDPLSALLGEAALACARVRDAVDLIEQAGPPPEAIFGGPHPFLTFVWVLRTRVAAFHGDIAQARCLADEAMKVAMSPIEAILALSCSALVSGNADERTGTRSLIKKVAALPPPTDAVTRGSFVLAAYGALALGDAALSAKLVLEAGGDADLSSLRLIDRAVGLEMLVAAAVEAGDLDSAESWLGRLAPVREHRIVAPTFDRATSRVRLLAGDLEGAVVFAERAVNRAKAEGRTIEATEGEMVRARARIAADDRGAAARDLATMVSDATSRGHLAIHRAAARELRHVGRRLPPVVASGWEGLSPREREVAVLVAEGHSNASLAHELFLSEHTVRIHVSRVLQAFGVATRSGVAATLAPAIRMRTGRTTDPAPLPDLTDRQREVVALLVGGAGNKKIAESLGISSATVEKHVSAILQRWRVTSRTAIVALASGLDRDGPP